jgi:hypothetical protein
VKGDRDPSSDLLFCRMVKLYVWGMGMCLMDVAPPLLLGAAPVRGRRTLLGWGRYRVSRGGGWVLWPIAVFSHLGVQDCGL